MCIQITNYTNLSNYITPLGLDVFMKKVVMGLGLTVRTANILGHCDLRNLGSHPPPQISFSSAGNPIIRELFLSASRDCS